MVGDPFYLEGVGLCWVTVGVASPCVGGSGGVCVSVVCIDTFLSSSIHSSSRVYVFTRLFVLGDLTTSGSCDTFCGCYLRHSSLSHNATDHYRRKKGVWSKSLSSFYLAQYAIPLFPPLVPSLVLVHPFIVHWEKSSPSFTMPGRTGFLRGLDERDLVRCLSPLRTFATTRGIQGPSVFWGLTWVVIHSTPPFNDGPS